MYQQRMQYNNTILGIHKRFVLVYQRAHAMHITHGLNWGDRSMSCVDLLGASIDQVEPVIRCKKVFALHQR